ncbi:uncharacterized protein [Montipora foliosa]|uniref:uncharacterized protein n=1 Tax=Montipora foliosa TaxID=591990 RepID=UPI0035F114BB
MLKLVTFSLVKRRHLLYVSAKSLNPWLFKLIPSKSAKSWQSPSKAALLTGLKSSLLINPSADCTSGTSDHIILKPEQKHSVSELLKVFNESLSAKSMAFLLSQLGRTVYGKKSEMSRLERESSDHSASVVIRLLDCIADSISLLQNRELAIVAWSLGKIKVCDHPIIKACENEIISRGLGSFDDRSLSQIAWGFSNMDWEECNLFIEMQKSILQGELHIADFDRRGLVQVLVAFAATGSGSPELYQFFLQYVLSYDFSAFMIIDLADIAWSFAKKGIQADKLFKNIEAELFRRGHSTINKGRDIAKLLWSFAVANQGSKRLFKALEGQILQLNNLYGFTNENLKDTLWAFEKVGGMGRDVLERLEEEVQRRGIQR